MIIVCPLSDLPKAIREDRPSAVVSLLSPHQMIPEIHTYADGRHLRLEMEDVSEIRRGEKGPAQEHVTKLLDFVSQWDRSAPIIIHCWAGISRSTAAALITQCALRPDVDEAELAAELGAVAPHAKPNPLLAQYADDILGRGGRLARAAESIWTDMSVYEGYRFYYPIDGGS